MNKSKLLERNKKDLNSLYTNKQNMKRGVKSSRGDELIKAIKEVQKDPEIMKEIKRFIEATRKVYKINP